MAFGDVSVYRPAVESEGNAALDEYLDFCERALLGTKSSRSGGRLEERNQAGGWTSFYCPCRVYKTRKGRMAHGIELILEIGYAGYREKRRGADLVEAYFPMSNVVDRDARRMSKGGGKGRYGNGEGDGGVNYSEVDGDGERENGPNAAEGEAGDKDILRGMPMGLGRAGADSKVPGDEEPSKYSSVLSRGGRWAGVGAEELAGIVMRMERSLSIRG